ncbi:TonB family protein [Caulobacter ginsengisoli]|uniref:TonB family protein n=1 Tax=Caulobacter ginsengisoli TaxID=400775 RepID=A0ABU0IMM0_9CAUL|nr:TonB family protein [Caulobacter ginsengisoli]MDQ0463268.1 TonB family protein [Caulobacter ginsengisoli]
MKALILGLALGLAALNTTAQADTLCDGAASGPAGEVKVSLAYDAAGQFKTALYSWSVKSPEGFSLSAAAWDRPVDEIGQSAALPGRVRLQATGSTEAKAESLTLEASVDGGPPVRSFAYRFYKPMIPVQPGDAKPVIAGSKLAFDMWVNLDPAVVLAARQIELTIRTDDGRVLERWTWRNDNAARQALGATAMAQARALAATPLTCPTPLPMARITSPDWTRRPSGEDLEKVYPARARTLSLSGKAIISCDVTSLGTLVYCSLISETPEGEGFGEAALKVTSKFRMKPLARDGSPVGGGTVRIPILFHPPD